MSTPRRHRPLRLAAGLAASLLVVACLPPPLWIISTVAGTGVRGFSGDGGPAISAQIDWPRGVAVGRNGSLFVADADNHRVRRIDPAGTITTVAGTGGGGYSGDGELAIHADLYYPYDVALDRAGNLYIADSGNYRVRKVDRRGVITTFAGNGTANRVCGRFCVDIPYQGDGGDGGPAVDAMLFWPGDLDFDREGNLYIAETGQAKVRKVDTAGVITTFAGTGTPGYSGDGGPAPAAMLNDPSGVAVDREGGVLVSDTRNHRIRRVDPEGIIATVAGTGQAGFSGDGGPPTSAMISDPFGIDAHSSGAIVFVDRTQGRLRMIRDGKITTVTGGSGSGYVGDGGPAAEAQLRLPIGVTFARDGSIYIADSSNHALRRVWPGGGSIGGFVADARGGVENATVRLYREPDRSTPIATTATGDFGVYGFQVTTGSYLLEFAGDAAHAGEWWRNAAEADAAAILEVGAGERVRASARLAPLP